MYMSYKKLLELVNQKDTPLFIKNNIDIIYRNIFSKKKQKINFKEIIKNNFRFEYYCIKNWYKKKSSSLENLEECDILFFFTPFRKDYEDLIYPVAKKIAKKNISLAFLIHKNILPNTCFLPNVKYYVYEDIFNLKIVSEARKKYKHYYLPCLLKWFQKTKIDFFYQQLIKSFFQRYVLDKENTISILSIIRPKCIYSIHYIQEPGCLDAISTLKNKPIKVMIQHGFLGKVSSFHDFKGADLVILWGNYHKQVLNDKFDLRPSLVLGNPKLEEKLSETERLNIKVQIGESDILKILYISSGSPLKSKLNKESLDIFVGAIKDQNFKITYKLHPGELKRDYKYYLKKRLINPEQLVLDEDILNLINQSDIIVGSNSTSLYEATVFMKPVINVSGQYSNIYWGKLGLAFANNSSDLKRIIFNLLLDSHYYDKIVSKQINLIEDFFNGIQGSSDRIADYLAGLLTVF